MSGVSLGSQPLWVCERVSVLITSPDSGSPGKTSQSFFSSQLQGDTACPMQQKLVKCQLGAFPGRRPAPVA